MPERERSAAAGTRGLPPLQPRRLPWETRNLSLAAYPHIVAKLSALKREMEAESDIFGPSEVHRGTDASYEPCASEARAAGCLPPHQHNATAPPWPLCCQKLTQDGWLSRSLANTFSGPREPRAMVEELTVGGFEKGKK